jgi:hypothetical protein
VPTGDDNDVLVKIIQLPREPRSPADVFKNPPQFGLAEHSDWQPAFSLSRQQREQTSEWMNRHEIEKHRPDGSVRYTGAIGGAYTWQFTPTTLGTVTKVVCSCGEVLDVSDYDW